MRGSVMTGVSGRSWGGTGSSVDRMLRHHPAAGLIDDAGNDGQHRAGHERAEHLGHPSITRLVADASARKPDARVNPTRREDVRSIGGDRRFGDRVRYNPFPVRPLSLGIVRSPALRAAAMHRTALDVEEIRRAAVRAYRHRFEAEGGQVESLQRCAGGLVVVAGKHGHSKPPPGAVRALLRSTRASRRHAPGCPSPDGAREVMAHMGQGVLACRTPMTLFSPSIGRDADGSGPSRCPFAHYARTSHCLVAALERRAGPVAARS